MDLLRFFCRPTVDLAGCSLPYQTTKPPNHQTTQHTQHTPNTHPTHTQHEHLLGDTAAEQGLSFLVKKCFGMFADIRVSRRSASRCLLYLLCLYGDRTHLYILEHCLLGWTEIVIDSYGGGVHVGKEDLVDVGVGDQSITLLLGDASVDALPLTHSMVTRLGVIDRGRMCGDPWLLRLDGNTQVIRRVPRVVFVVVFCRILRHFLHSVTWTLSASDADAGVIPGVGSLN